MDEDSRRRDDIIISALSQKLDDFIDRYERDWQHTQNWRTYHDKKIQEYGEVLNEIVPNYRRGVWAITIVIVGSIGIAVKVFWAHIGWR